MIVIGDKKEPDFMNLVDIHAFFGNEFGACGCYDMASMIEIVKKLMVWIDSENNYKSSCDTLFPHIGLYYLIMGTLEKALLVDHGSSARWPWLTLKGKALLEGLEEYTPVEIEDCLEGLGYDSCYYGWQK
jgi:hypothetical protein